MSLPVTEKSIYPVVQGKRCTQADYITVKKELNLNSPKVPFSFRILVTQQNIHQTVEQLYKFNKSTCL